MRSCLIGSVALAACTSPQRIDLCRRGDRVDVITFQLTALDGSGSLLDQWEVAPDRKTTNDGGLPGGTRRLRAEGLDAAGVTVAIGETDVADPDAVCVCVAPVGQRAIACEAVECRIDADRCVFTDEAGAPVGARTFTFGDNASDDVTGSVVDTYLSGDPAHLDDSYGAESALHVNGDPMAPIVSLFQFDLRAIPSTAQITSATLALTTLADVSNTPVDFHAVLEPWTAGIGTGNAGCSNWTCRQQGADWAVAGAGSPGSSDATPLMSVLADTPDTVVEGSAEPFRALVQQWVAMPDANNGVVARMMTQSSASLDVSSSEGADGTRPALRVELTIPDAE